MIILSKSQHNKAVIHSLFEPINGKTLAKRKKQRYDMGKYKKSIIGRNVDVTDNVLLLWAERRMDKHGPYYSVFCYESDN